MAQLAVVEAQQLQHQEAGVADTDWATIGIYFLKGVHPPVPPVPPPDLHPPLTAGTETAAIKGIGAGKTLLPLHFLIFLIFFYGHPVCFLFKCHVFMLPAILAPSQTAASQVTSDLSCHDEVREEHVVVGMTGIEDVAVEREDVEEEEKPTEEGGKLINIGKRLYFKYGVLSGVLNLKSSYSKNSRVG